MRETRLQTGTGQSLNRSAFEAGREAALAALHGLNGKSPDLILVFATAGYDQAHLLSAIREVTGPAPLAGCSTSGTITSTGLNESSHSVAVHALASEQLDFDVFHSTGLMLDSERCARETARQINRMTGGPERLILAFPDGVTGTISGFLGVLQAELTESAAIAGGTAGELLKMDRTWQYHGAEASSDSVTTVLIRGSFTTEITVSHGCDPIGTEQIVTRADKGWIYEIDGEPAWSVYKRYLDLKEDETLSMGHTCYICLAEHLPEPDPAYGPYIIRCPLQLDREKNALFFPGDIQKGAKVRMALRNEDLCVSRANASAAAIVARHPGVRPDLVLQFDCCCRGQLLFGSRANQASVEPLRRIFGLEVPWFGFSTYGEIAPLYGNQTYFHNYTTVLCAFYPTTDSPGRPVERS